MIDKTLWVEKYRPRSISEMIGHDHITNYLDSMIANLSAQHLLFFGRSGVGKTTAAVAIARQIFQDDMNIRTKIMNASDERGIDIVRGPIKEYARISPEPYPIRIIILDEADQMTADAQNSLRHTMESYDTCRFILTCNNKNKIIDAIQSRCSPFYFRPLPPLHIKTALKRICQKEKLKISSEALDLLVQAGQGDLRQTINRLQTIYLYHTKSTVSVVDAKNLEEKEEEIINKQKISDILNIPPTSTAKYIILPLLSNKLSESDRFNKSLNRLRKTITEYGITSEEMITLFYEYFHNSTTPIKPYVIDYLATVDHRISQGGTSDIQLSSILTKIMLLQRKVKRKK